MSNASKDKAAREHIQNIREGLNPAQGPSRGPRTIDPNANAGGMNPVSGPALQLGPSSTISPTNSIVQQTPIPSKPAESSKE